MSQNSSGKFTLFYNPESDQYFVQSNRKHFLTSKTDLCVLGTGDCILKNDGKTDVLVVQHLSKFPGNSYTKHHHRKTRKKLSGYDLKYKLAKTHLEVIKEENSNINLTDKKKANLNNASSLAYILEALKEEIKKRQPQPGLIPVSTQISFGESEPLTFLEKLIAYIYHIFDVFQNFTTQLFK